MLWGGWDVKRKFWIGTYTLIETALVAFEGFPRR
jgi:hypothetical protein